MAEELVTEDTAILEIAGGEASAIIDTLIPPLQLCGLVPEVESDVSTKNAPGPAVVLADCTVKVKFCVAPDVIWLPVNITELPPD